MRTLIALLMIIFISPNSMCSDLRVEVRPSLGEAFGSINIIGGKLRLHTPNPGSKIERRVVYIDIVRLNGKPASLTIACVGFDKEIDNNLKRQASLNDNNVTLAGYESIDVIGIPSEAWQYVPPIPETNYQIENIYIVLKID